MNAIGIVAEYNPLHNGHCHHIAESRNLAGLSDAPVICVMSGAVTQRGDLPILSKWARAEAAVSSGANLIIELPAPYACSSAEKFAWAGVYLLALTGQVGIISFGAECGELEPLEKLCCQMETKDFGNAFRDAIDSGMSYPAAVAAAVSSPVLLEKPNNMLGLCYLKALRGLGAPMKPIAVRRRGPEHDSDEASEGFASASTIRRMMMRRLPIDEMVPTAMSEIIKREVRAGRAPVSFVAHERLILATLRRLKPEDWKRIADVSEGLDSRLFKEAQRAESVHALFEAVKTKRYTMARLRRIVLRAYLGIPSGLQECAPPYLRVLAFDKTGAGLLREMRKTARAPVIIKPASYQKLESDARNFFELECAITDATAFHRPTIVGCAAGREMRTGPVFLK